MGVGVLNPHVCQIKLGLRSTDNCEHAAQMFDICSPSTSGRKIVPDEYDYEAEFEAALEQEAAGRPRDRMVDMARQKLLEDYLSAGEEVYYGRFNAARPTPFAAS